MFGPWEDVKNVSDENDNGDDDGDGDDDEKGG